eukprot:CAMPEP_0113303840 /NCGR_PEP_ID=MMETSP0010_2-20120614/4084_1 /TAXON_ID=216773 ORGANISM="Corethron hystrix, Strain 308" /NCGR_SAMPLE_ID=MMETSP0010_2 /ASSEMBLY_ACC=CAM_ASM_000155 /LENGTH=397 /DNA_ID=CAMNT_0000157895 /DNA_START=48 /DNA_END=1242 /DNA_ORIENTATION=+ /assembly_acc=CAM_ASM_000155
MDALSARASIANNFRQMDSCGNGYGLLAAFVACIGFGSFGAPLKSEAVNMVNPNPFVLQTYKSAICFITCWIVLLLGAEFEFTTWGIVSGFLWVTGGVGGIYGIRNAGLAISVGTWSSVTVLISFAWGIFFFDEEVQSIAGTSIGVVFLLLGFVGMAYFSSAGEDYRDEEALTEPLLESSDEEACTLRDNEACTSDEGLMNLVQTETNVVKGSLIEFEVEEQQTIIANPKEKVGLEYEKKLLGLLGAVLDGVLGGSNLIPMKLAPTIYQGLDYTISFAIGAAIATLTGWILYFLVSSCKEESFAAGYQALPSLHLRKIWMQGTVSGTLWSIGNVSQILSVTLLGESIGMSIIQSQMIISGLLGIVLFKEIKDMKTIIFWVASAVVTFTGIVFLSHKF